MGDLGRLLVTGASGFIGQAVVQRAVAAGWHVTGLARRDAVPGAHVTEPLDLADPSAKTRLIALLPHVDAIIHCAASLTGDQVAHARDTDLATQQLLQALNVVPVRLVHVSSIATVTSTGLSDGALVDESTPMETASAGRDAYASAKLAQEWQMRDAAQETGLPVWIMRPGAVFGPHRLWNAHIGPAFGPTLIRMEQTGEVPLCFIDHCADALVRAAGLAPPSPAAVVHVLDDDRPERARFLSAMQLTGWPERVIPFNWRWLRPAAAILGQSGRAAQLFHPATLRARYQPLRFGNDRMHHWLGCGAQAGFEDCFAASLEREAT